ncbi:glycosyltransferase, partial [uncultured Thermanaerothrix sp.]|uniref:glycosyltransferase n=1 Tax=uncultured Thermanaerothrix sp. TaxID=1195149 RepID=UPI002618FF1E
HKLEKLKPMPLGRLADEPLVSVLMPNYNYGRYIGEAIESVLRQTYQQWELIICDDGSTDNSCEVVKRYQDKDSRIKLIQKENGGMASALNIAYRESRGSIICLLDADDVFLPTKFETVVEAFNSPPLPGFVTHRMQIVYGIDKKPGVVIPIFTPLEHGYLASKVYKRGGRWRYMPASAICLRREVANLLFPLDEGLFRSVADGYIFTLAAVVTTVKSVDKVLSLYRLHGANFTGGADLSPDSIRMTIRNIEQIIRGVNNRLQRIGLPLLEIDKNLNYVEQKTFLSVVEPSSGLLEGLRMLIKLSAATLKDDLYTPLQKVCGIFAYWSAVLLPKRLRARYIKTFVGPSRLKALMRRIWDFLGEVEDAHSHF